MPVCSRLLLCVALRGLCAAEETAVVVAAQGAGVAIVDVVDGRTLLRPDLLQLAETVRHGLPRDVRIGQINVFPTARARRVFADSRVSGASFHGPRAAHFRSRISDIAHLQRPGHAPVARVVFSDWETCSDLLEGAELQQWCVAGDGAPPGHIRELWLDRLALHVFVQSEVPAGPPVADAFATALRKAVPGVALDLTIRRDGFFALSSHILSGSRPSAS